MEYGIRERAVMIALMALNREMLNTELRDRYRLDLRKPAREKLNREGLLQSRRLGSKGFAHELTDAGWAWVVRELDDKAPGGAGSAGGALYALLNGLKVALDARGMLIQELFAPAAPKPAGSLRDRIRQAYRRLARRPWDWVELRDLRAEIGDWPRRELDLELVRMFRDKDVNLTLHEDQGRLTQADRDAALRLGVDDMHLISME